MPLSLRNTASSSFLEVHGELDSPVNDVFDARISVHAEEKLWVGSARPVAVGAIIGTHDVVSAVVTLLPADFDRVWALALSGHLKLGSMTFTKPKYGSALVVNTSFSSVRGE